MQKSGEIVDVMIGDNDMLDIFVVDEYDVEFVFQVDEEDLDAKIAYSTYGKFCDDPIGAPVLFDPDEGTFEIEEP